MHGLNIGFLATLCSACGRCRHREGRSISRDGIAMVLRGVFGTLHLWKDPAWRCKSRAMHRAGCRRAAQTRRPACREREQEAGVKETQPLRGPRRQRPSSRALGLVWTITWLRAEDRAGPALPARTGRIPTLTWSLFQINSPDPV